ncbi:R3H domain-containing nucleic acid-binding protein [Thermanaerothrix sp. 4228-RoL]|uniref:R3H domain-containing nucleic acid-binding protein n=2 Tax=Thermanaerothrix TaxID=1077886 RepID=A0ABU3NNT6_9CHLR|nr:R3H domain-containing nucleic acid-binding protein [Thermanaerothrix sp. 4228-RoL]MDT8898515.1 R3H domain-containing nucleic acid-binding protein [Thermanaerothrix sp. 4228-RoL]
MTQLRITDDLQALLDVLPPRVAEAVVREDDSDNLLEIILDLGRPPMARFVDREVVLLEQEVTHDDIQTVVSRVGEFDADNRAGLERTLHRISAIRNRKGHIVGLTCRVGRAVYGTIDIIQDLIESGKSILLLGRPGVGKTTMLREAARILAEKTRVVIVDTSNEIGGDGDVPHPAVGKARRMQVPTPSLQHEVMIEAVENHNPEVIIIDEIGRELEAQAARTIAERGVQLVATAHGRTLENLLLNPTLSDLVGGVESVTLSDEEARRRGTQKTVLERRSPPTFDVLVEIQERNRLHVHADVAAAVDALLRGYPIPPEIRYRDENGEIHIERPAAPAMPRPLPSGLRRAFGNATDYAPATGRSSRSPAQPTPTPAPEYEPSPATPPAPLPTIRIYPYGVARNRLLQAAKRLGVPAIVVPTLEEADVLMTLRTYYRSRQQPVVNAEERQMPIYVLRANTINQMEQSLVEMFNLTPENTPAEWEVIAAQTQIAIQSVLNGQRYVDLPPASAEVRRFQHQMARQYNLVSHSYGKEPNRRVRIFRD